MRLSDLMGSYSPRAVRVDEDHVLALAEVLDRLPPVVVDQRTMKVIDGVHRVEASRRLGRTEIRALLFSGSGTEALVVAVQANIRHGKPLAPVNGKRQPGTYFAGARTALTAGWRKCAGSRTPRSPASTGCRGLGPE